MLAGTQDKEPTTIDSRTRRLAPPTSGDVGPGAPPSAGSASGTIRLGPDHCRVAHKAIFSQTP